MRPPEPHDPHERLVVVTWRIPQADADALEAVVLDEGTLGRIRTVPGIQGVFTLSTCQRKLVAFVPDRDRASPDAHPGGLAAALALALRPEGAAGLPMPEVFRGWSGIAHLSAVATGLDALVPGEPQVLGQFRDALKAARDEERLDPELDRVLRGVLRAARTVRDATGIGHGAVSLVPRARPVLQETAQRADGPLTVALVGTGRMARAVVAELGRYPVARLHVVSRDAGRAERFAAEMANKAAKGRYVVDARDRRTFHARPPNVDLLVLATERDPGASSNHVVDTDLVARLVGRNGDAPTDRTDVRLTILDLCLPRLADPAIRTVPGCHLVQIDDLAERSVDDEDAEARHRRQVMARIGLEEELGRWRRRAAAERDEHRIRDLHRVLTKTAEDALDGAPWAQGDEDFRRWYRRTTRSMAHEAVAHLRDALASASASETTPDPGPLAALDDAPERRPEPGPGPKAATRDPVQGPHDDTPLVRTPAPADGAAHGRRKARKEADA